MEKRYDKTVDITIRMPLSLRALARKALAMIEGTEIRVPGVDAPKVVKPSIAVLAIRGLEKEAMRIIYQDMKDRKAEKARKAELRRQKREAETTTSAPFDGPFDEV